MDLIREQPDDFSGAILASGGSIPIEYKSSADSKLSKKRFYITLGENDYPENIESASELKQFLEKSGAKVIFKLQPNAGHQYPMSKNEEMIKFLLGK